MARVNADALSRDEMIFLRKAVRLRLKLRKSPVPTHGLPKARRQYLNALAATFTKKEY